MATTNLHDDEPVEVQRTRAMIRLADAQADQAKGVAFLANTAGLTVAAGWVIALVWGIAQVIR